MEAEPSGRTGAGGHGKMEPAGESPKQNQGQNQRAREPKVAGAEPQRRERGAGTEAEPGAERGGDLRGGPRHPKARRPRELQGTREQGGGGQGKEPRRAPEGRPKSEQAEGRPKPGQEGTPQGVEKEGRDQRSGDQRGGPRHPKVQRPGELPGTQEKRGKAESETGNSKPGQGSILEMRTL